MVERKRFTITIQEDQTFPGRSSHHWEGVSRQLTGEVGASGGHDLWSGSVPRSTPSWPVRARSINAENQQAVVCLVPHVRGRAATTSLERTVSRKCPNQEKERQFIGTWWSEELKLALEERYQGMWDFVGKVQSDGWPSRQIGEDPEVHATRLREYLLQEVSNPDRIEKILAAATSENSWPTVFGARLARRWRRYHSLPSLFTAWGRNAWLDHS